MKKYILLAAVAALLLPTTSEAAAIKWSLAGNSVLGISVGTDGTITETTRAAGVALYFYLGTTTDEEVKSAFTSSGFDTSATMANATFLEQGVSNAGGARVAGNTPVVNDLISSSSPNNFFVILSQQVDSTYYYKVVTGTQTGYETTGDPLPTPTTMAWTAQNVASASYAAVPEPSTAALALAGLALLIKRRRA